jgi:hypothetical protein
MPPTEKGSKPRLQAPKSATQQSHRPSFRSSRPFLNLTFCKTINQSEVRTKQIIREQKMEKIGFIINSKLRVLFPFKTATVHTAISRENFKKKKKNPIALFAQKCDHVQRRTVGFGVF